MVRPLRRRAGLEHSLDPRDDVASSGLFSSPEERRFAHEQRLTLDRVLDRVASTSVVAELADRERHDLLARVRALLEGLEEPIVLRYVTEVFVADRLPGR